MEVVKDRPVRPTVEVRDFKNRLRALKNERNRKDTRWRELAEQLAPFAARWDEDQRTQADRDQNYSHIYDATGLIAVSQTAAGLMSYGTSPARPWHSNTVDDKDLADSHEVKGWLAEVTEMQRAVLRKSNAYLALPMMYEHLIVFGTACALVLHDPEDVVRFYVLAPGTYYLAQDDAGKVDTLYREFAMTTAQIVQRWPDTCSQQVKNAHKQGNLDQWWTVVHVIEPRLIRDIAKPDRLNMPFRSVYFEAAATDHQGVLSEGGFRRFPVLAPRWKREAADVYGHGPGYLALPFCNQLQAMTLVKGKAAQSVADPAWQIPAELKNSPDVDTEPGGHNFYTQSGPNGGIRPLRESRIDLAPISADILDIRNQIRAALFADLFTMLVEAVEGRMTAAEFGMRVQQKMLMLGPVVQSLNTELLGPMLDLIYEHLAEGGVIPVPPPIMAGRNFVPEFVGVLAQAQKASGIAAINQLVQFAGSVAQAKPDVLDILDIDKQVRNYADMLGVDPDNLVPPERVDELRQARARAEAAKEQMAMIEQQASAARDLSQAQTTTPSLLTGPAGPVGPFAGYGAQAV